MQVKTAQCTACGAHLELIGRPSSVQCSYCHTNVMVSHAIHLASQDIEYIDDLAHARDALDQAIHHNNIDDILTYAQKLKDWLPDDVEANYYYAYGKQVRQQPSFMTAFYQSKPHATPESLDKIAKHMMQRSDLRDRTAIEDYLSHYVPQRLKEYQRSYEVRYHQEDQYANVPRDVFICHSSVQSDVAQDLMKVIEAEGYISWISIRNLRPQDSDNYWHNIEEAIKQCKVMLVVSTQEAMVSKDVQKEIEIAKKYQKTLIEFKYDDAKHTMYFKHAFDGIKWIEGVKDSNQKYKQTKQRLFEAIDGYQGNVDFTSSKLSRKALIIAASLMAILFASLLGVFGAELRETLFPSPSIPVIIGAEDITVFANQSFDPLDGISAADEIDGNVTTSVEVTGKVLNQPGTYRLTYIVTNSQGQTTEIEREIRVHPPSIPELRGINDLSILQGEAFNPLNGITASDPKDGNLTANIQITGTVNTNEAGTYTLTYRITNSQGQTEQVTRRITILETVRYTVSFNSMGGSPVSSQQIQEGARLDLPQTTKSGHTLLGWYISFNIGETFDERWNFNTNTVSNDVTLYARWQINTYSIQLNVLGGEPLAPISETYQSEIASLPTPTKEGHTFLGWYQDLDFTTPFELPFQFTENTQAYAQWQVNTYSLTFDTQGGNSISPISQHFGTSLNLPTPTKEGHTFKGWHFDSNFTEKGEFNQMISRNANLYARWDINEYTITFETNINYQIPSIKYKYGDTIEFDFELPSVTDFRFTHWYLDSEFIERFNYTKMPSKDLNLYLRWVNRRDYGSNLIHAYHLELNEVGTRPCGNRCTLIFVARYELEEGKEYRFNRTFDELEFYKLENGNFDFVKIMFKEDMRENRIFSASENGLYYIRAVHRMTKVIRNVPIQIEVYLEEVFELD